MLRDDEQSHGHHVVIRGLVVQSWKKLHAAHAVRADISSELRTFGFRNHAHLSTLQFCEVILIYFEVNIEE